MTRNADHLPHADVITDGESISQGICKAIRFVSVVCKLAERQLLWSITSSQCPVDGTYALIMAIAAMNNSEEEKPFVNKYESEGLLIL